jgi:FADH2 O2-dependent halogenase
VVPFDNHKDSRNKATAVTLTLDPARYPAKPGLAPEEEFFAHAARFPDIATQFDGVAALREWRSEDRLQYSSAQTVGDRWCLLGASAGYVDPLFSRDLSDTAEAINSLAWRLLRAVGDDDFSAGRFAFVNRLQQNLLDFDDDLVASAYSAFDDSALWNAVFKIWAWGSGAGTFRMQHALTRYLADGDDAHLNALEDVPHPGYAWPDHEGYVKLFAHMTSRCEAYRAGDVGAAAAGAELFDMIADSGLFPRHMGFAEREQRFVHPTPRQVIKSLWLTRGGLDPDVRTLLTSNVRTAATSRLRGRRIF